MGNVAAEELSRRARTVLVNCTLPVVFVGVLGVLSASTFGSSWLSGARGAVSLAFRVAITGVASKVGKRYDTTSPNYGQCVDRITSRRHGATRDERFEQLEIRRVVHV